jgi:hypothetical protein
MPRIKENVTSIDFVDWDHRPAVLVGDEAFAVLRPGEPWVSVDRCDVGHTGALMSEVAWRRRFVGKFGHLEVLRWRPMAQDNVPQSKPLPRAKDFDDAVRAVMAAHLEHKAREALKPDYSSAGASAMAWAQKYLRAKWDDTDLALYAIERERRAREAIKLGLSELLEPSEVQNPAS